MNTKKQQCIKDAYGEYWEQVKDYVDEYGWLKYGDLRNEDLGIKDSELEWSNLSHNINNENYRPKSLQGIETNNNWVSIESEDDLPKEVNNLWLLANDGSIVLGQWCIFQKIFKTTYGNTFDSDGIKFTHYQPIIKPSKPLY